MVKDVPNLEHLSSIHVVPTSLSFLQFLQKIFSKEKSVEVCFRPFCLSQHIPSVFIQ